MQFSSVKGRQVSQCRATMKALVLSVLLGFALTISLANPINQQDAAPDDGSLRDVADDLESYNPERQVSLKGYVKFSFIKQLYKGPITTAKRDTSPCLDHFLHCPYSNILVPPFPFPSKFIIDILLST